MATLILTSFMVAVLTVTYLLWRWKKQEGELRLPPGPRGLPLVGYLPFLTPELHRCCADLARVHGPVMSLRLGIKLCVVISSPAAVKEALKDYDAVFANREVPAVALASPYANDMVWAPYGPRWRMLRKVTVRELLSPAAIDGFCPVRQRVVRRMLEEVRRRAGEPLEVRELFFATSLDAMTTMLWGDMVSGEGNSLVREFQRVIEGVVELEAVPNVSDFLPALAWLDVQGLGRRMRKLWAWLDRVVDAIIEQRLRSVDGGVERGRAATNKSRDFVQAMVELLQERDPQVPLTMEQVRALFVDMVAGGTDTTTTTMEWAMAELLCNPEMMAKAKEEIEAVVGKDGAVEESHLPKLHYLDAVVKEVLRLHPLTSLLPRRPSSTCIVGGYRIPEGTKVLINAWAIHRDPQYWEDASTFKPERFLSGGHTLDYIGNSFQYIPFGVGRRICVGMSLAERMVLFMLASLLHSFDWTLPEGVKLDLSERFGVIMKMEKPLVVVPMRR